MKQKTGELKFPCFFTLCLLTTVVSLDIQFSDDGITYATIYQLDYNKKAVGSLVTV